MKKGFTLIELLTSGLILVIAMALIAVLYGKASKIRTIVTGESDIQGVANQMMDTIISGGGAPLEGLRCATRIYSNSKYPAQPNLLSTSDITFGNVDGKLVRIKINTTAGTETVKKGTDSSNPIDYNITDGELEDLDFNNKIDIVNTATNNSRFCYYKADDTEITDPETDWDKIAKIMICLAAKSSLSAISRTIILYNSVTIRNIYHID